MTPDRVGVAPGALHRVRQVEAEPSGRGVERLARANGKGDRKGLAAAAGDAVAYRDLLPRPRHLRDRAQVAQQYLARGIDRSRGVGDAQLDRGEVGHAVRRARDRAARDPGARRLEIILERALRRADRDRGEAGRDVAQHGHGERRVVRIELGAGRAARGRLGKGQHAMRRHEHVVEHERLAAGPGEADHVPGVVDRIILRRGEEKRRPWRCAVVARRQQSRADRPTRIVAAAGKAPASRHAIAARHRDRFGGRRIGAAQERVRVAIPHVVLRLCREARQQPLMRGEKPRDPRGRRTSLGKLDGQVDQQVEVVLVAAECLRLHDVEEAHLAQHLDACCRHGRRLFGGKRLGFDPRQEREDLGVDGSWI